MDAYRTALYLHILTLLLGFSLATLGGVCLFKIRGARTLEAVMPWAMTIRPIKRVFPWVLLSFLATGAYMTSDVWTWRTSWVEAGLAALVVLGVQGLVIAPRAGKALGAALQANGPGELGPAARAAIAAPILWLPALSNPALVLGVVWDMTDKPSRFWAFAVLVVAWACGAALALVVAREPAPEPAVSAAGA